jgi:peptide/nickel transport system ATP-binding protein
MSAPAALQVSGLQKLFPIKKGFLKRTVGHVRAVDGVDFPHRRGRDAGLVGESGCGKTTTARCILRRSSRPGAEISMRVADGSVVEMGQLRPRSCARSVREMQMIFQDPFTSLNPRMTLLDLVGSRCWSTAGNRGSARSAWRISCAGRAAPGVHARFPALLQRRRAPAHRHRARAGAASAPGVADEPVSALDVSVQAQILNLLSICRRTSG